MHMRAWKCGMAEWTEIFQMSQSTWKDLAEVGSRVEICESMGRDVYTKKVKFSLCFASNSIQSMHGKFDVTDESRTKV